MRGGATSSNTKPNIGRRNRSC